MGNRSKPDRRVDRVVAHQLGVRRLANFSGEERWHCCFRPVVVSTPPRDPVLEVVSPVKYTGPLRRLPSSMPMPCTGGRLRCFHPYCTARFPRVAATLFQFSPYSRAGPCQLNSRASTATLSARAVLNLAPVPPTEISPPAPRSGDTPPGAAGRQRSFKGSFRRERSRPSR
jgi:hypothetical protein